MKKIIGRRFSLDAVLKTSSYDQFLSNLSSSVKEDYGQERELRTEGCEVPISSNLETNEDSESAIIVRGEGSTMNTKQEFIPPNESSFNELPPAPLCRINVSSKNISSKNISSKNIQTPSNVKIYTFNSVDAANPTSSDENSLFFNCNDSATDNVATPALNLTIDNNGTDPCRMSSHDDCSAKSDRTSSLLKHRMTQSCKESFCNDNGRAISYRTDNHRKRSLIYSNENGESCDHDFWTFQTKTVKTNQGINCADNFFRCVICNATYDENVCLERHMLIHSDEKTFSCELSQKSFQGKDDLDRHNCVHLNVKPFSCELCGTSFEREYALKKHMMGHSNVITFSCEHCNLSFKRKDGLQRHEVIHFDEKPFSCEHCNRSFKTKEYLTKHEVIHSDEKPFVCEHCHASFKRKFDLKRHKVIHSDEKPFVCEHCHVSFKRMPDLKRHKVIHSDERPFRCKLCNGSFNRKVALQKHKTIHLEENLSVASSATEHAAECTASQLKCTLQL